MQTSALAFVIVWAASALNAFIDLPKGGPDYWASWLPKKRKFWIVASFLAITLVAATAALVVTDQVTPGPLTLPQAIGGGATANALLRLARRAPDAGVDQTHARTILDALTSKVVESCDVRSARETQTWALGLGKRSLVVLASNASTANMNPDEVLPDLDIVVKNVWSSTQRTSDVARGLLASFLASSYKADRRPREPDPQPWR